MLSKIYIYIYIYIFFFWTVTVVVLLLSGQFNTSTLILGRPGTCEKIGLFQCNNGKCISRFYICNSHDDCGDNSDESKTTGAFCGMLLDTFVSLTKIFSLTCYDSLNYVKTNVNLLRVALKIRTKKIFLVNLFKMVFTYGH